MNLFTMRKEPISKTWTKCGFLPPSPMDWRKQEAKSMGSENGWGNGVHYMQVVRLTQLKGACCVKWRAFAKTNRRATFDYLPVAQRKQQTGNTSGHDMDRYFSCSYCLSILAVHFATTSSANKMGWRQVVVSRISVLMQDGADGEAAIFLRQQYSFDTAFCSFF